MTYDDEDKGLAFLSECIKAGKIPELVSMGPDFNMDDQTYYVQWETLQSLETGILFIMGVFKTSDSEIFNVINTDVMKSISFHDIWNRNKEDIYEFIVEKHKIAGHSVTFEEINNIKIAVEASFKSDDTGFIFHVSPLLSILNALINLYLDGHIKKMVFVAQKKYCHEWRSMRGLRNTLTPFFSENKDYPVYIDITSESFGEYISRLNSSLNNSVIVTMDKELLQNSIENPKLDNATFIVPRCQRLGLSGKYIEELSSKRISNEYILYEQKILLADAGKSNKKDSPNISDK
jgi:hypothetical protein